VPFFTGVGQPIVGAAVGAATGAAAATGDQPVASGASGRLRIEPEQVDGAIAVFRNALNSVKDEVRRARAEIDAQAPADDDVSNDAAAAFNQASQNAVAAWEGAVLQLQSIIDQLEASKLANQTADTDSASFLRSPG
jgi:hypothetical protein